MFGSELRHFDTRIRKINDLLCHSVNLVAKNQSIALGRVGSETAKFERMFGLLDAYKGKSISTKCLKGIKGVVEMFPRHGEFGSKGGFVNFSRGRGGTDAAEQHFVSLKGIAASENAAHIVRAANIVQHHNQPARGRRLILLSRDAAQLLAEKFPVFHCGCKNTRFPLLTQENFSLYSQGYTTNINIMKQDKQIFQLIEQERTRQSEGLELIASENYVSDEVLQAMGSVCTNKYAEGYPGHRYYGGCQVVDKIEQLAIDRLKAIYGAVWANVQPHSGAQANMAVTMAVLSPGETFLGLDLSCGGHLTHGSPVNASGMLYHAVPYGLDPKTGLIDYDEMEELALKHRPKLIIGGASAYSREWDYERMRKIADEVGAILWIDMAHTAGLIAAGLLKNPVHYAHIVTSTTHKTLRGPRGGVILMGEDFDDPRGRTTPKGIVKKMSQVLDSMVFPGVQGGPLEHVIAAKAVAFHEALQPEFADYQKQVLLNAATMADEFLKRGYKIVSGGTDNHLMLIDLRGKFANLSGKVAERELVNADITVNKNMVPGDSRSAFLTSGLRIGTPAITTRGFKEPDMATIVSLIDEVLCSCSRWVDPQAKASEAILAPEHLKVIESVKTRVKALTAGHPLFAW